VDSLYGQYASARPKTRSPAGRCVTFARAYPNLDRIRNRDDRPRVAVNRPPAEECRRARRVGSGACGCCCPFPRGAARRARAAARPRLRVEPGHPVASLGHVSSARGSPGAGRSTALLRAGSRAAPRGPSCLRAPVPSDAAMLDSVERRFFALAPLVARPALSPGLRATLRASARGDQVAVASAGTSRATGTRTRRTAPSRGSGRLEEAMLQASRQQPSPPRGPRRELGHASDDRARRGDPSGDILVSRGG